MSKDERYLVFTLENGTSYEEIQESTKPHMKSVFKKEVLRFDLSGFQMERSDKDIFKDNYQMLNLVQLDNAVDTYNLAIEKRNIEYTRLINKKTLPEELDSAQLSKLEKSDSTSLFAYANIFTDHKVALIETAISQLRSNKTYVTSRANVLKSNTKSINRHLIEWHRKFTLSFACVILFFIGAPLGAIIRKGGLGMPVVISVLFFLVYHITSITSEKMVKQGELEPFKGMWMASIILLPIGLFLTYKASTDSSLFNLETYSKSIRNFFERILPKKENPIKGK